MGYTHYFGFKKDGNCTFKLQALKDIEALLNAHTDMLRLEFDNDLPPICESSLICFNGIGGNGYEAFYITPSLNRSFCKTNQRPYDLAVCEVLLVLLHHYRDEFELNSDGLWVGKEKFESKNAGGKWNEALHNVQQKFGYGFNLSPRTTQSNGNTYYYFELSAM